MFISIINLVLICLISTFIGIYVTRKIITCQMKKMLDVVVKTSDNNYDIMFAERADAEKVIDSMQNCLLEYGVVTLADLSDMVGTSTKFEYHKYGWTNILHIRITHHKEGYLLRVGQPNWFK